LIIGSSKRTKEIHGGLKYITNILVSSVKSGGGIKKSTFLELGSKAEEKRFCLTFCASEINDEEEEEEEEEVG
jgi:hypothetical protein